MLKSHDQDCQGCQGTGVLPGGGECPCMVCGGTDLRGDLCGSYATHYDEGKPRCNECGDPPPCKECDGDGFVEGPISCNRVISDCCGGCFTREPCPECNPYDPYDCGPY